MASREPGHQIVRTPTITPGVRPLFPEKEVGPIPQHIIEMRQKEEKLKDEASSTEPPVSIFKRNNNEIIEWAKPGVFLDIGCSEGCYLERMSKRATRVIAFEPLPTNINHIIEKYLDHLPNIELHGVALWNTPGKMKFYLNGRGSSTLATSWQQAPDLAGYQHDKFIEVEAITLDSLNLTDITVCKIDVERCEQYVLEGGAKTFTDNKMLMSLETHKGIDCERIEDLLHAYGYKIWAKAEAGVCEAHQIEEDRQYFLTNDPDVSVELLRRKHTK